MRHLTPLSRRRFGQGLGASLTLAALPRPAVTHSGPREVEVRISRFAVVPARVKIAPGDTLVWVNDDLAPHTATAHDGNWQTVSLDTRASARVTFKAVGTFDYFCAFHPQMTGIVSVRPKSGG